jgi:F-type H+-transporting ATPase subunit epsilon
MSTVTAFKVDIITPEEVYFSGEAVSLAAPGILGYLGVLVDHAPLVTPLGSGRVELRQADRTKKVFQVEGGFLEVASNHATLLVEKIAPLDPSAAAIV